MSRRQQRLNAELHRAIQNVISRGFQDPRFRGLVTVTKVEVGADFRDATVHVSVMPAERESASVHALRDAARHIRREAGDLVALARMPELHFKVDRSLKQQADVIAAINRETASLEDKHPNPEDDAGDGPAEGAQRQ